MTFMNSVNLTNEYTFTYSKQTVSFLDVYLSESRKLKTKLYKKHTDCMALLYFHSHHLLSCKEGITNSQALRYNMIISEDHIFQEELNKLTGKNIKNIKNPSATPVVTSCLNRHHTQKQKFSPLSLSSQTKANYLQPPSIRVGIQLPMTQRFLLSGYLNHYLSI